MTLTRRSTMTIAGGTVAAGVFGHLGRVVSLAPAAALAATPAEDQHKAERTLGDPAAKMTVLEFFR